MHKHFRVDVLTAGFIAALVMATSSGVISEVATQAQAAINLGRARSMYSAPRSFEQGSVRTSPSNRGVTLSRPNRHP
jgi:hypothetical protein